MKKRFLIFLLAFALMMIGCGNADSDDTSSRRKESKTSVSSVKKDSTDEYHGTRYQPITDDMYTAAVSGYIEGIK